MPRKPLVAIIGLGLMGGSLGAALRRSGRYNVLGIARRLQTIRDAKRVGAVDRGSVRLTDAAEADIIVLATPVATIGPMLHIIASTLRSGTVVTDVGSVKGEIARAVAKVSLPPDVYFIGSHPLAGSHRTGVNAARADLFRDAACVVVPGHPGAQRRVEEMWRAVGGRIVRLSASEHDAAVAVTSHLPHLLAHAIVHVFANHPKRRTLASLVAGSFRDMTRVASADPNQWVQIFQGNEPSLRDTLSLFRREMDRLLSNLGSPMLKSLLKKSHRIRQPMFKA
jgi:prephenate dehydrogenase